MSASDMLFQLICSRRSVRKFTDQPVEREKLILCLDAARHAPSAENVQPWRFIVIDEEDQKSRLIEGAFSGIYRATRWAAAAPVIVVLCAQLDWLANRIGRQITGIHYYLIDLGIAGEHFVLQAHALGLGICWIGWFNAKGLSQSLGIPKKLRPVAMFAVGYPATNRFKTKKLLPLEEIAYFNQVPRK